MGLIGVVVFVLLILFAVFFHELGHFATARWAGIKVTRFFVGFGPTLWSFRRGAPETVALDDGTVVTRPETEYGIKLLPLGGFVKVLGMSPFEEVVPKDEPRSFGAAPAWKRAIVLAAGSVTHLITAFLVLFLIFSVVGIPTGRPTLTIEGILQEVDGEPSPAVRAGLRPGDTVVAVDGRRLESWDGLRAAAADGVGRSLELTVRRGDAERVVTVTPAPELVEGQQVGLIGLQPERAVQRIGPVAGITRSARLIPELYNVIIRTTPRALSPSTLGLTGGEGPSDERPVSLVGAGRVAADLFSRQDLANFLFLFVQINLFIALFNMLPLPPLDGGHLAVLAIEKVRRRRVDPKALLPVMAVVFSLLVVLTVLLLVYDIVAPVQPVGP